jgi:hypothetical protein
MKKVKSLRIINVASIIAAVVAFSISARAYKGMPTPPLHVEGRFLKDPCGNNVLLHGWMQPTASWFNGNRWYRDPTNWNNTGIVAGFLNFMNEIADLMTDTSPRYDRDHGWYCSFVRVNTDAIGGWTAEDGLVSISQFDGWINNFLVPYTNHLRSVGLYLVLSATGPVNTPNNGTRNAGVIEQQRLRTFWQRVANAAVVKNIDNIMFELMNEPVDIESSPGNGDWGNHQDKYFSAFRDWIQPIIDDIRDTGAENVIWVPTLEWQGSPYQWALYPFTGTNIGVACHYYPAYGGVFDNATAIQLLWDRQYKPAADRWPMIITEMFWTPFPNDPRNLVNGRTAGFGNAIRNAMDHQGNVSYLVGFIGDLIENLGESRPHDCYLSPKHGAQSYFDWLPSYTAYAPKCWGSGIDTLYSGKVIETNRPNPFTHETLIEILLPETGNVIMEIYNINGKKVKTLVNQVLVAGKHDISWSSRNDNGNAVSSGIYFCKIQVGGQSKTYHDSKKIILLK